MKRWMLSFLAVLFSATLAAAQQTAPHTCDPAPWGPPADCGLR